MTYDYVQQWLASVPEGSLSEAGWDSTAVPRPTTLESEGERHVPLEPTEIVPSMPALITRGKEQRKQDFTAQASHRSTVNPYERKSRRKTRDDKYEYKRQTSKTIGQSEGRRDRVKGARVSRKYTINDAFHASNVTQGRLTLRDNFNVGIFGKGKASRPVKLRAVQANSFSETKSLASPHVSTERATIANACPPRATGGHSGLHQTSAKKSRSSAFECDFRKPSKSLDRYEFPNHRALSPISRAQEVQSEFQKPQHRISSSKSEGFKIPQEWAQATNLKQCSPSIARSATPYSWSISNGTVSRTNQILCDKLLDILHTGLFQKKEYPGSGDATKKYYNLEDLKFLLRARKASWESDSPATVSNSDVEMMRQSQYSGSNAVNCHADFITSTSAGHDLFSSERGAGCQYPSKQRQTYQVPATRTIAQPIPEALQAEVFTIHAIEDDNSFFENLDAAYREIVGQESLQETAHDNFFPVRSAPTMRGLSCTAPELKDLSSFHPENVSMHHKLDSFDIPAARLASHAIGPASHPFSSHEAGNVRAPWLRKSTTIMERTLDKPAKRLETPTAITIHQTELDLPVPPEFWKQKRLF
ncbi:hypothetical protein PDE_01910 [Penicillium oxalicum 114-2]|uniref:Uncharacterized protein n=1 Tax=Penicillium oxalicum (strain 114-2 / CGMCC 5302) TaxID=933388 RepID=S7Z8Q5_PENO1|nr:hypothetical protein PDE_01910 [Penicillium oxalicum 114-2]